MAALLLLCYGAICVVIFRLLRMPINKWTITTAGIGGVIMIGGLLLGMNYNDPYTTDARLYFFTTPIISEVKRRVIEVPVKPNLPLRRGDPLFKIDPRPYQFVVDQKKAAFVEAQQNVKQLKASLDQASAGVDKAKAQLELQHQNYDRQAELRRSGTVAQAALDTAQRNLDAATQSLAQAEAAEQRARLAYKSQIGGVNTTVARLAADLRDAEYDLDQTTARAPTDGYVTQLFLRPGMMAGSSPATIFIHDHDRIFAAAFPQTVVQRLRRGAEAEIAFDGIPGRVFQGKVNVLIDAISHGQLQASNALLNPEDRSKTSGLALVRIDITSDLSPYHSPPTRPRRSQSIASIGAPSP